MIEVWAGLTCLSQLCEEQGCKVVGIVEKERPLKECAAWRHEHAETAQDYYDEEWMGWKREGKIQEVDVLTGGFACVTLSKAGRQLMERDVRSRQLMDTLWMAVFFRARLVLLENVGELLLKDSQHGMLTEGKQYMSSMGYTLVFVYSRKHSRTGGGTQRQRVFPGWVTMQIAMSAAPVGENRETGAPELEGWTAEPGKVRNCLRSVQDVPGWCILRGGEFRRQWIMEDGEHSKEDAMKVGEYVYDGRKGLEVVPGSIVKVRWDMRWWIVDRIENDTLQLFYDSRKHPDRVKCSWKDIQEHGLREENVFSIEYPGITIRNMSLPFAQNGMLVNDTRIAQDCVRWLVGDELSALQEVEAESVNWLTQQGCSLHRIGKWAGNCVPKSLGRAPVETGVGMVKLHDEMVQEGQRWEVPVIQWRAPAVEMEVVKLVLLPMHADTMEVWLPETTGSIWGEVKVTDESRESACKRAAAWATKLQGGEGPPRVELAADYTTGGVRTRVVVWVSKVSPKTTNRQGFSKELQNSELRSMIAPAVVKAATMIGKPIDEATMRVAEGIGSVPITMLETEEIVRVPVETQGAIAAWKEEIDRAHELLREELLSVPEEHPHYQSMMEWMDRIATGNLDELTEEMCQAVREYVDDELINVPFSHRVRAPSTRWTAPMGQRMPPPGFAPRSLHDILRPWAYEKRKEWYKAQLRDLRAMIRDPKSYRRECNWTCVIGEGGFYPDAYGIAWNFGHRIDGVIQPFDYSEVPKPWLDVDYMMEQMGDEYPDQEILGMLKNGVTYKAEELEYQIVLNPHMVSLKDGCAYIFDEMVKLTERGWYAMFYDYIDNPPCMPERTTTRGARPRPNEPERPRPLSHGGMPMEPQQDESGRWAYSINEASKWLDAGGREKWPKEIKPRNTDAMTGLCVLIYLANILGTHVYLFTDDASNFFNQAMLGVSQYCQNVTFMYDYKKMMGVLVAEYCMAFGLSPASCIAQRIAILILDMVKKEFDAEEDVLMQTSQDEVLKKWWAARKTLSEATGYRQHRAYHLEMYTDDPIGAVVHPERMKRFLLCWTRVTKRIRLLMAIPMKRQLGCVVKWIGAKYVSLGLIFVPKDKRVKAIYDLRKLLSGQLNCGELRSLNGLLEFLMVVVGFKRDRMQGMWEPFGADREAWWGSETKPNISMWMRKSAWAWITALSEGCAAPFSVGLEDYLRQRMSCGRMRFGKASSWYVMTSDASKEGAKIPGMGGYMAGMWWTLPLDQWMLKIDIPALELMAFGINVITFHSVVQQLLRNERNLVVAYIDAQASPQLLLKRGTTSLVMSRVLAEVLALKEFTSVKSSLAVAHTYGEGNGENR